MTDEHGIGAGRIERAVGLVCELVRRQLEAAGKAQWRAERRTLLDDGSYRTRSVRDLCATGGCSKGSHVMNERNKKPEQLLADRVGVMPTALAASNRRGSK